MASQCMQGIRTLVAVNSSVVVEHEGDFKAQGEYWRYYPDDNPFRGLHAGDTRAAVAPYLAHHVSHDATADSSPPYHLYIRHIASGGGAGVWGLLQVAAVRGR